MYYVLQDVSLLTFRHERNHLATKIEIPCLKLSILLSKLPDLEKVREVRLIIFKKKIPKGHTYLMSYAY